MEPKKDEEVDVEQLRDEMIWDEDGAMVIPERDDEDDYNDRASGREY